jgi:hypothetical protein
LPISPRLDSGLYFRIRNLVRNSNEFIFFGTFSINVRSGIIKEIAQKKTDIPELPIACLLPPPTDFIIWNFSLRSQLHTVYNIPYSRGPEIQQEIANDPKPAFRVLDSLWSQGRNLSTRNSVLSNIRNIATLYQNGIITFLEPNTHAKFIVSENNVYEGSGNLTMYGLEVNVEVYNFYSNKNPRVYDYAWRSYRDFLIDYLSKFVNWKDGANYLGNAKQLSNQISQFVNSLGMRFNPTITQEKIEIINEILRKFSFTRSDIWMFSGHIRILKDDFLLRLVNANLFTIRNQMFQWRDKKLEEEILAHLHERLEISARLLKHVITDLSEFKKTSEFMTDYERKYEERLIESARIFLKLIQRRK